MARRSFSNPFDEENTDPFADHGGGRGQSNYGRGAFFMTNMRSNSSTSTRLSPLPPEPVDYNHWATFDIPLDRSKDIKEREKELQSREAELKKWEQELKRREDVIKRAGILDEVRNWPPFFPIIHHDIANEIPAHLQKKQYAAFATFLGFGVCLLFNFSTVTIAWTKGEDSSIWFVAIIYLITGIPGAYISWYRPLYRAMRNESVLNFGWFFVSYIFHIGFCAYATIAPPMIFEGGSLTGVVPAIEHFGGNQLLGTLYLVGAVLFCIEATISVWVLQEVYMYFRGSGKAASIKRQATTSTMMATF